jgi:hypothetical protein
MTDTRIKATREPSGGYQIQCERCVPVWLRKYEPNEDKHLEPFDRACDGLRGHLVAFHGETISANHAAWIIGKTAGVPNPKSPFSAEGRARRIL